jgi:hypothetical protein
MVAAGASVEAAEATALPKLTVESGHAWTPPFELQRVGRPLEAVVEAPAAAKPGEEFNIVSFREGKELRRRAVAWAGQPQGASRFGRVTLDDWPTEVALVVKSDAQAQPVEVARAEVKPASFEAEAAARPERGIHPVDLGTIMVPADWLLLSGGQKAEVEVAALSRGQDLPGASIIARYESSPGESARTHLALTAGRKALAKCSLPSSSKTLKQDTLQVLIVDGAGRDVWSKKIRVMLVPNPPQWPAFGAVKTKLRYDAPIPVAGGKSLDFEAGWDKKLDDVVVFLPNGARFVWWRGSSYCPFWASRANAGFSYEWAEMSGKHMTGQHDCVEPLQDKELRYGRVEIVESTPARAHVRWRYQSCDLDYRVWGDHAVEDFYFYPDGFATRVLTLTAHPEIWLETNEFILFTPQSGYPFNLLPERPLDVLWPSGKASFTFPVQQSQAGELAKVNAVPKDVPLLHRVRFDKSDRLAAICYSPFGSSHDLPGFPPFYDRGALVTPMYWGCHWPLSRGYPTGWAISDRIGETPGHNSCMHAGTPKPLRSQTGPMPNGQGKTETLRRETYVWLIGMTDAGDDELRQWAASYGHPPKLEAQGARVAAEAYVPERRALCLEVQAKTVAIHLRPDGRCVCPVFELKGASKTLSAVRLDDRPMAVDDYRWDGSTLWLRVNLDRPATLKLDFAD